MDDWASRVAWAIETIKDDRDLAKGITDLELAKVFRTDKNTLARYRQKKTEPSGKVIDRIITVYNFSPQWLFKGEGEPFPGARARYPEVCGPESTETASVPEGFPSNDFVFVRQVRGKISAGGGLSPDNAVDLMLAFRKDWIKRKGKPENMSLIKVQGDSMEPTLLSGDLVLVDHNKTAIAPQGGIYAISINHEIMLKRVQILFPEARLRIISDNKQYEPIEAPVDQVRVNGKVIWYGRDLER